MISNLAKLITGIVLALSLLALGSLTVARYLIEEFTAPPPKPIFAEELATPQPSPNPSATPSPSGKPEPIQGQEKTIVVTASTPTPTTSPTSTPSPTPIAKPEGKGARVTWAQGLTLRSSPNGETTGGVDYNAEVVLLETSPDGNWQKIWVNGQEGWVKAGNVDVLPETE